MLNMNSSFFTLLMCLIPTTISLKIYKSKLVVPNIEMISGLVYKKNIQQNIFVSNNFATCVRVKMKRLALDKSAIILLIEDSNNKKFLKLFARYPATWFKFGNPYLSSWIIYDPALNDYGLWNINTWHHICFSYRKLDSYTSFVKVSKILKYFSWEGHFSFNK